MDLDFAVDGSGIEIASELVKRFPKVLAFAPLDNERGTARVIFRENYQYFDISTFKGRSLKEDLRHRDFTINAMAMTLRELLDSDNPKVIDYCGGREDLNAGIVRACSDCAFTEDPLRVLRAFRFAAQLNFNIEPETMRSALSSLPILKNISGERIRDELVNILSVDNSHETIIQMDRLGVIDVVIPELLNMKGCGQNNYHHLDVWNHSIEAMKLFDDMTGRLDDLFGNKRAIIQEYLDQSLVLGRPTKALLRLAILFHDSGKPESKFIDSEGKTRFFGHERVSAEKVETFGRRIKLSNKEIKFIGSSVGAHMQASVFTSESISNRTLLRFRRKFGENLIGLLLIFLSDLGASQGPARKKGEDHIALGNVNRALEMLIVQENPPTEPLLTGTEIMEFFGLKQGPEIGMLVDQLREMQENGAISTVQQALIYGDAWKRRLLEKERMKQ